MAHTKNPTPHAPADPVLQRVTALCHIQGRRLDQLRGPYRRLADAGIMRHFRACDRLDVPICAAAMREIIDDALQGRQVWDSPAQESRRHAA